MQKRWMRIGIGVLVLASLVLLGALIVLFNSLPRVFRATNTYTAQFADATGLSPGAPVRRSGVPVGVVGAMALDDQTGEVNVRLDLDQPHTIRKDEQVTLVASLLGGDAAIDLVPVAPPEGQAPDRTPLPPGTVLVGVRAGNFNQLISRASDVVPTTQETLNDIRKSMQRIEKMTPLVEDTFREYRDLGRSLNNSVPDLRHTNDDVDKLVNAVRDAVPDLRKTNDDVDKLATTVRDAVPQVTKDADQLTRDADDAAAAARSFQKVAERVDVILQQNQDKINQVVTNFNDVLTRTSSLLSPQNVQNATDTLHNTKVASDSFPSIARNSDETLKEGREAMQRFNATLIRTDDLLQNLQKITKPLADRSDPLARNLDESLSRLNHTLSDVNQLTQAIGQSDGTLHKLLTDPSLYNHLDDVACQAAKAAPQLNLILRDFEIFADKLARHPELIGAGGIVRPSSGLKDPPEPSPGLVIPPTHP